VTAVVVQNIQRLRLTSDHSVRSQPLPHNCMCACHTVCDTQCDTCKARGQSLSHCYALHTTLMSDIMLAA
jgi:hypothetical protein